MSFDPERWLKVADVCCINIPEVNEEALLRTAVNRAYYAALLSVRRRIEIAQGADAVPSFGTHQAILQAVRTGGDSFTHVYKKLLRLQELRTTPTTGSTPSPCSARESSTTWTAAAR